MRPGGHQGQHGHTHAKARYLGLIPRKWQPTIVFWPGEFHGQRNLSMGPQRVRHDGSNRARTHVFTTAHQAGISSHSAHGVSWQGTWVSWSPRCTHAQPRGGGSVLSPQRCLHITPILPWTVRLKQVVQSSARTPLPHRQLVLPWTLGSQLWVTKACLPTRHERN